MTVFTVSRSSASVRKAWLARPIGAMSWGLTSCPVESVGAHVGIRGGGLVRAGTEGRCPVVLDHLRPLGHFLLHKGRCCAARLARARNTERKALEETSASALKAPRPAGADRRSSPSGGGLARLRLLVAEAEREGQPRVKARPPRLNIRFPPPRRPGSGRRRWFPPPMSTMPPSAHTSSFARPARARITTAAASSRSSSRTTPDGVDVGHRRECAEDVTRGSCR
jgi:hypothetical protein